MEPDPEFMVRFDLVLLDMNLQWEMADLPAAVNPYAKYPKADIQNYLQLTCDELRVPFDSARFEHAYKAAEKKQRKQDDARAKNIAAYPEAKQDERIPRNEPERKLLAAYNDFLATRKEVIRILRADPANTVIVWADAVDNAVKLGAYLGGVECLQISPRQLTRPNQVPLKYTNVILYGHIYYLESGQVVLGEKVSITPLRVATFLGDRDCVSVLGCTSIEFTTELLQHMKKVTYYAYTTKHFRWIDPAKNTGRLPFIFARDTTTNESFGTLFNILDHKRDQNSSPPTHDPTSTPPIT